MKQTNLNNFISTGPQDVANDIETKELPFVKPLVKAGSLWTRVFMVNEAMVDCPELYNVMDDLHSSRVSQKAYRFNSE